MKFGWTYPERRKLIEECHKGAPTRTMEIDFQNRKRTVLRIITVDIDFPKYRLANGRTYDMQADYLAKNNSVDKEFFEQDPESDAAQTIQHSLLKELIHAKELFEYFESHEQDEPLIFDNDGFVINGNRRLCAMREHYYSDQEKYKSFKTVDCAILPPASDEDIDELEARLQEHPDIKDPYSWTSRVIMYIKRKKLRGYDDKKISDIYETTESEIRTLYKMLSSAEAYLRSRGKDRQFHLVSGHEFSFRQIAKCRPNLDTAEDRDIFENVVYSLIDNPDKVGGRVYEKIPQVAKHMERIKKDIKDEFETSQDTAEKVGKLSELGELFVEDVQVTSIVSNPENSDTIKDIVVEILESERSKRQDDKKRNAAAYLIEKASENLNEAKTKLNSIAPSKVSNVANDVESINVSVEKIAKWLSDNS